MRNFTYIFLIIIVGILSSCGSALYTAEGYENDDIYYTPGEADRPRYSEYESENEAEEAMEDDYYSEERIAEDEQLQASDQRGTGNTYNNYYNYYRYQQSPFARHGFYDPVYSSAWFSPYNTFGPTYGGWNISFGWNVGYNWGSPCYSWYRRPCFMWGAHNPYTPFWNPYDPFYAGTYYSPFYSGYYGYGYGFSGYHNYYDGGATGYHYGHRTPIASNADVNSNYTGGTIYAVRNATDTPIKDRGNKGNVPSAYAEKRPVNNSEDGLVKPSRENSSDDISQNYESRTPAVGSGNVNRGSNDMATNSTTEYYQWKPTRESAVERKPRPASSSTTSRPSSASRPDVETRPAGTTRPQRETNRPDYYRKPDRTTDSRTERSRTNTYRERTESRSTPSYRDRGSRSTPSRGSRPSYNRPSRSSGSSRPSYNRSSRSSRGGSYTPSRSSGGSRSTGGSTGGSRSSGSRSGGRR